MPSQWHRIALYFGLGEETADDRRMREALPTPSVARLVLGYVITAVVAGAIIGILDGNARSGAEFGAVMAIVLASLALWQRRKKS